MRRVWSTASMDLRWQNGWVRYVDERALLKSKDKARPRSQSIVTRMLISAWRCLFRTGIRRPSRPSQPSMIGSTASKVPFAFPHMAGSTPMPSSMGSMAQLCQPGQCQQQPRPSTAQVLRVIGTPPGGALEQLGSIPPGTVMVTALWLY